MTKKSCMHKKSVFFSRFLIARPLFSFIASKLKSRRIQWLCKTSCPYNPELPLFQCFHIPTYKIFSLFYGVFKSSIGTFQLVFGFNFIRSNDKVWQGKLIDFWMRHPVPLASFTHDVQRAVTKIDQHRIIPVMLRYKRVFLSTKMPKLGQNRYEAAFDFH